ncbi:MAG: prenyltransferase [Mycobacteriales bacterium]
MTPELAGVLPAASVAATAASIAAVQEPSGAIPWFPGGHVDPWDHVECAMALAATGSLDAARRAYRYAARSQRPDGSWPCRVRGGVVEDATAESNQCAYLAVGVWHYLQVSGDVGFAAAMWPAVRRGVDFAVDLQRPRGEIGWARSPDGRKASEALLTGCSSIHHSLRAALALADVLGEEQPDWELAAGLLAHAVAAHPEAFLDKSRFSMDWYYPVLGGVITGSEARARLDGRWGEFVLAGLGARCVADRPWVTGAETCELVLALDAAGERDRALGLLADIQHLREADGSYWTGLVVPDGVRWPVERSTWTAAAVVLAVDALAAETTSSGGAGIFRGEGLPAVTPLASDDCGCLEPEAAR